MDTENLITKSYQYLDCSESTYIIQPSQRSKFRELLELMRCNDGVLTNKEPLDNTGSKNLERLVGLCLTNLSVIVSEKPIDDKLKQFCLDYCCLVSAWNQEVLKDQTVYSKIQFISRIINKEWTFDDSLLILRHLYKKLEKDLKWRPPAFDLSDHYYNLLKE